MSRPRKLKWKCQHDEDGLWWEIDIPLGAGIVNILVSEDDEHWGYTIADGGGSTIQNVDDRFDTRQEAQRDALEYLENHCVNVAKICANLRSKVL